MAQFELSSKWINKYQLSHIEPVNSSLKYEKGIAKEAQKVFWNYLDGRCTKHPEAKSGIRLYCLDCRQEIREVLDRRF